jgi:hypothetical protein
VNDVIYLCWGGGVGVRESGKLATSLVTESDLMDPKVWSGERFAPALICTIPLLKNNARSGCFDPLPPSSHFSCIPYAADSIFLHFFPDSRFPRPANRISIPSRIRSSPLIPPYLQTLPAAGSREPLQTLARSLIKYFLKERLLSPCPRVPDAKPASDERGWLGVGRGAGGGGMERLEDPRIFPE